jgi:hypothetical protein
VAGVDRSLIVEKKNETEITNVSEAHLSEAGFVASSLHGLLRPLI